MEIPESRKSDHLFLLIGENPLPNYVAAMLLTATDRSNIYLIYSQGKERAEKPPLLSTQQFAEFLESAIKSQKKDITIHPFCVNEVSSEGIRIKIREIIREKNVKGRVGFNYTGARKPMAVHTYLELLAHLESFEQLEFSYLDANSLSMFFDGVGTPFPVADEKLEVKLKTLAALHGYNIPEIKQETRSLKMARILQDNFDERAKLNAWRQWMWDTNCSVLPDRTVYAELAGIMDALDEMFGDTVTPALVAQELGFDKLESCITWFRGGWLEEIAFDTILSYKAEYGKIHDFGIGLKPVPLKSLKLKNPKNFEIDCAAMIGYQLFFVSGIASDRAKGETKKHLFEAFVRARQLGGEEARIALLTLVDNPLKLEDEIKRDWHTNNQIRVFGRDELNNLSTAFHNWFDNIN